VCGGGGRVEGRRRKEGKEKKVALPINLTPNTEIQNFIQSKYNECSKFLE
jgi:DNA-binding cell septation regulator SpoVG